MPKSTLDLALDYLDRHMYQRYIFPIKAGKKFPPLIRNNLEDASNDPQQIIAWAKKWPGCNWGLSHKKSKVLVADVDTNQTKGKVGQITFDALDLAYGWPATEETYTPSGGHHHIYLGDHIFALGENGIGKDIDSPNYTLIAGCSFEDGTSYTGNGADAVACPSWIYDIIKIAKNRKRVIDAGDVVVELDKQANIDTAIDFLKNDAEPAIEGSNGDFTTLKTAMYLKDLGISAELAVDLLNEYYNPRCVPPWDRSDLEKKVANAFNYASFSKVGGKTAEADFGDDPPPEPPAPKDKKAKAAREKAEKDAKTRQLAREAEAKLAPDQRQRTYTKQEVIDEFVFITGIERFVKKDDTKIMWKKTAFDSHFAYIPRPKRDGTKSMAEILLRVSKATIKRYTDVCYKPGEPEMVEGCFNLYNPSDVVPEEGDVTWWDEHCAYLFPNETDRNIVLNWMAWMLQNLKKKPKHALLIQGPLQGTGKSFLAEMMTRILHRKNVTAVSQSDLHGQFNGWAARSKLLVIEELRAVERAEVANKLHPLITQDVISINEKNIPVRDMENCFGIFAMTNNDAAVLIDNSDRRYAVVRTDAVPRSPEYYASLYAKLEDPAAVAAVAYSLMKRDLQGYSGAQAAPTTAAKADMIEAGMSDLDAHLLDSIGSYPLNMRIVAIEDVIAMLPKRLENRSGRLAASIKNFLTSRLDAVSLGQCALPSGKRPRLYALRNQDILIRNTGSNNGALYEREKAAASKGQIPEDEAATEFYDSGEED